MKGGGRRLGLGVLCALVASGIAFANAPQTSIRPEPRTAWSATAVLGALQGVRPAPSTVAAPPAGGTTRPSTNAGVPVYFNARIRPAPRPWLGRTQPGQVGAFSPNVGTPARATARPTETGTSAAASGTAGQAPERAAAASTQVRTLASTAPVFSSPRPVARPDNVQRRGVVRASGLAQAPAAVRAGNVGAICGVPGIRGRSLPTIVGRLQGCGVANPVQVTEVAGIALSSPATMDCDTARAFHQWAQTGAIPAMGRLGGGIAQFRVAAHYSCRTRNSQPGARISEHGKGKAVDIAAIRLRNGVDVTVLDGWRDRTHGPILRRMWGAACGPFGTVLGPDANAFHRDHFHFDTASYRSGSYCR